MSEINEASSVGEPNYKSRFEELQLKYEEAQKLLGKKSFTIPDDNSSEEEFEGFLKKIGAPDNQDEYEFDESMLFEGYDDDLVKASKDKTLAELKQVCHQLKLPKRTAKKFAELIAKKSKETLKEQAASLEKQRQEEEKRREEEEKYLNSQLDQAFGTNKVEYLNKYSPIFEDLDLSPKQKAKLMVKMKDAFPIKEDAIPKSGLPNSKSHSDPFIAMAERMLLQQRKSK